MLVPYNRKNHSVYNPFQDFDDLERAFFSDRSLGELKTDIKDTGDSYTLEASEPISPKPTTPTSWRRICPASRRKTSTSM